MRVFLIRFFIFLLIFSFISSIFAYFYNVQSKKNIIGNQESISNLILGDSHAQGGLNNRLFPKKCVNWANSGENYFYSYSKLNYLICNNVKIENVFLTYGPHNLDKKIDTLWVFNKDNFLGQYRVYSPFISFSNLIEFIRCTPFSPFIYFELIPEVLFQSYYSIERQLLVEKFVYSGGFEPLFTHLNDTITTKYESTNLKKSSETQTLYLDKIIQLCEQNKINLYLLNLPLYNGEHVNKPITINNNYILLDYGAQYRGQNKLFADFVHLNAKGADEFTKLLIQDLKMEHQ